MKHQFIINRDIIMFSFQSWDTAIGSNFKDMAIELARHNRILFVNRTLDQSSLRRKNDDPATRARLNSIRTGNGELEQVAPNIWVHNPRVLATSINRIPSAWIHDLLNKRNNRRIANEINKVSGRLEFSNVILINDNDFIRGFYLKEFIPCAAYLFYLRDYMLGVDFFKRHGPRLESGLMKKVDLVVANSAYLAGYASRFNPKSFDIGQGCDFSSFLNPETAIPADLAACKHPIIGYTGFVSAWRIDAAIIALIARRFPDCSVVLVGPVDHRFDQKALAALPNIYFLGGKSPEQLASYINHFDICLNPQILNEITRGNYPRKADEYLAMGKPLVATGTEGMAMFAPYCYLCSTPGEYIEKISAILDDPGRANSEAVRQQRTAFALSHSWEESIGMLGDAYFKATEN